MDQAVENNPVVTRDDLKKIRVFSNGVWQFQPHLHFMQTLFPSKEKFEEKVVLMRIGGVIQLGDFYFKMDLTNVG